MSSRITVLQASDENLIQGGSRNNPELAGPRYGLGEPPTGYSGTHATLNDRGKMTHTNKCDLSEPS